MSSFQHNIDPSYFFTAALDAVQDKEAALEALRQQTQLEREEALAHLKEQFEGEISQLRCTLSEQSSELELARLELERLESEVARREQGLGSATTTLDRLRQELATVREELMSACQDKENSIKERDLLLVRTIAFWTRNDPVLSCVHAEQC